MKKLRFGDLVRNSGRPKTFTLWTTPNKSKELQDAIRTHRVMTVHRHIVGSKADVGEIGFHQDKDALYLIFPRRLEAPAPAPVVGINYELLEEPTPAHPVRLTEIQPPKPRTKAKTPDKARPEVKVLPSP